jgi:hypothetical protein
VTTRDTPEATDLAIDTTGWLRCPSPGCGWLVAPKLPQCPDHPDLVPVISKPKRKRIDWSDVVVDEGDEAP